MESTYSSKNLGHIGIVSGMIDELGLVSAIDNQLQTDGIERTVSLGTLCKALILNGLGFSQRTLYMVPTFFADKPIELLLGEGIAADQLNDTVLGRCLDAIHSYGCTTLYANIAPQICERLGLKPKIVHMDSTDFHVDGVYNSRLEEVGEHVIHIRQGYSRDHRPDLNQVVLNLIVDNEAGIALHMAGLDGNTSDKTAFNETIRDHIGQLQAVYSIDYVVMDSAGYTQKTITDCGELIKWISRVPDTLKESKRAIESYYETWTPLSEGYDYVPLSSNYGDIEQRWLLVYSQEAFNREIITLKKKYAKESEKEYQAFLKLTHQVFDCERDAQKAADAFVKKCNYLSFNDLAFKQVPVFGKKGRPEKGALPVAIHFQIQANASCEYSTFEAMAHTKGKFIVATNELNALKLDNEAFFKTYKGQSKVEKGFRFLKDPQFIAATLFVKKPERVEALLFIMTLCLTVYAAIEYRIRQKLQTENETLPNQLGKEVKNPTARWVFSCFTGIHVLYDTEKVCILNFKPLHLKILNLLGHEYRKYYLLI
jgi:transposase